MGSVPGAVYATSSEPKRTVKAEKRHGFVGEDVRDDSEIAEVAEDSTDAKKWPLWKPSNGQDEAVPRNSTRTNSDQATHPTQTKP
ncbi:hypothetical protein BJV77DRAFT_1037168, partial [Russula vinacea]